VLLNKERDRSLNHSNPRPVQFNLPLPTEDMHVFIKTQWFHSLYDTRRSFVFHFWCKPGI